MGREAKGPLWERRGLDLLLTAADTGTETDTDAGTETDTDTDADTNSGAAR